MFIDVPALPPLLPGSLIPIQVTSVTNSNRFYAISHQIDTVGAENATKKFQNLVYKAKEKVEFKKKILSWDKSHAQSSLDSFYATILTSKHFPNDILDLKILMQKALIFSHGQAHMESRCSIKDTFLSTSSRRVSCKSTQN